MNTQPKDDGKAGQLPGKKDALVKAARDALDALEIQHATRFPLTRSYSYSTIKNLRAAIDNWEAEP